MVKARLIPRWGLAVLLVACNTGWGQTFDAELLKGRLAPRVSEADLRPAPELSDEGGWQSEEEMLAQRHRQAKKLSQSVLVDNLETWAKDTPLESVEKLRRTDFKLGGQSDTTTVDKREVDVSVRIAEQLRLRVTGPDFERDILYDPIDERLWVDLWQRDLPEYRTGLKLTNTYQLDNDSTNLILKIQTQLE